ncbi:hypothetical protein KQX54_012173 [Cotesia glomerata]|uniref:Uncharacterized protein n=1 Tax=Cotesia glomerata TaxID=32391 RepID=A0AAV7ID69_COTGL|nr:hypothetical protein KQX54_012173 [Cotesia glomerata]
MGRRKAQRTPAEEEEIKKARLQKRKEYQRNYHSKRKSIKFITNKDTNPIGSMASCSHNAPNIVIGTNLETIELIDSPDIVMNDVTNVPSTSSGILDLEFNQFLNYDHRNDYKLIIEFRKRERLSRFRKYNDWF